MTLLLRCNTEWGGGRQRVLALAWGVLVLAMIPETQAAAQTAPPYEIVIYGPETTLIGNSNPWGLNNIPDGPISFTRKSDGLRVWTVSSIGTVLLRGPNFDALTPTPLVNGHESFVLAPSGTGFDADYAGAYAVLPAANGTDLLMFYHAERHPCNGTVPSRTGVGLARSSDGGVTWQRRGQIVGTAAPAPPTDCTSQPWGAGNPTVFPSRDGQFLYMLFTEWLRGVPVNRPDVIYLARAPLASDGEPGAWQKYSDGAFSQPGLTGFGTPVIGQPPPNGATTIYAGGPSVSFNSALQRYVAVFTSRDGFHVSTSLDGVTWDNGPLILPIGDFYLGSLPGAGMGGAYPTLLSPAQTSQLATDQTGYLIYARLYPNNTPPHEMVRRNFAIGVGPLKVTLSANTRADSLVSGDATTHADSTVVTLGGYGISTAGWSAAARVGEWVKLAENGGTVPTGEVSWTRSAQSLVPGSYIDSIVVTMSGGAKAAIVDSLRVTEPPVDVNCAVGELLGSTPCLSTTPQKFLDLTGNNDGSFNLGDLLSYLDRKKIVLSDVVLNRLLAPNGVGRRRKHAL